MLYTPILLPMLYATHYSILGLMLTHVYDKVHEWSILISSAYNNESADRRAFGRSIRSLIYRMKKWS